MELRYDKIIAIYEKCLKEYQEVATYHERRKKDAENMVAKYKTEIKNLKRYEKANKNRSK